MAESEEAGRLELPAETMRALGYRAIDLLVARWAGERELPVTRHTPRAPLAARLDEPPPEGPADPFAVLERFERDVAPFQGHIGHPRFFAFVPSPSNFVGVVADALAAGLNPFCGTWLEGPGPAQVELVVVDWLRRLCGLPEGAGGLFVSGGSVANLTALVVAREERLAAPLERGTAYLCDQAHSSVERALRVLGLPAANVRKLPADADWRLPVAALRAALAADRAAGFAPFCVVASAGTTNTGAVDPLPELADLCAAEGLWLHVDGAYGAAAVLAERGRAALAGLERADSLSLDPHKWLFQPFACGCVLLREGHLLRQTFHVLPEYLQDVDRGLEEVNFCDLGIELTRGFRALKLWLSLQVFGLAAFRRAVERGIELAERAEALLRAAPERWRVVAPASLGVVCFRWAPPGLPEAALERANRGVSDGLLADGTAFASSTRLGGRTVLRLCTINPRTTEEDLAWTLERMAAAAERAHAGNDEEER
ncbi:MAG TPA: aminotransferase class I/II-fold pyridoxal phosphate-dependent enzyme [Thermoanaerobaculia bacterium]|nr:aminotransferase class I/II-fold pyridoxal phosphate-dependent enzyme [Thermoanaerobaculia bacterium]